MSLLADMLSKVKHEQKQGVVPPNLAQAVSRASDARKVETRVKIAMLVFVLLIAMGFGTVYYLNTYVRPGLSGEARKDVQRRVDLPGAPPQTVVPAAALPKPEAGKAATLAAVPIAAPASPVAAAQPSGGTQEQPVRARAELTRVAAKPDAANTLSAKDERTGSRRGDTLGKEPLAKVKASLPSEKGKGPQGLGEAGRSERDTALYAAKTYEEEKNYGQAVASYRRALEKDPRNYLIMNDLAGLLITMGLAKESIQYSMNVLTVRKDYAPSLINVGVANIQIGNPTEGEMYLVRARSLEPTNRVVLFNLGLLYEKLARYDEAVAHFRKLGDAKDVDGYLGVARVFEKEGKQADARKAYESVLAMENVTQQSRQLAADRLMAIKVR